MIKTLKIKYDGGIIDPKLDDALRDLLAEHGFEMWACGMNLTSGERDLAFEKDYVPPKGD